MSCSRLPAARNSVRLCTASISDSATRLAKPRARRRPTERLRANFMDSAFYGWGRGSFSDAPFRGTPTNIGTTTAQIEFGPVRGPRSRCLHLSEEVDEAAADRQHFAADFEMARPHRLESAAASAPPKP